ncbi:hypothetical protein [Pseudofrankia inefficax]|uniref:NlpC/P60 domain-containing protein n=1 Tax=Pseudofrankia inefficax (strain DSM 45817 / CECT 9037 / DDB 130130 / EuI1c) TaxID=298654 RepID=E3ITU1_PSEI1|nr:hypothetical protein [Pseudofrankia inefficax]ADP79988.1 hypothetical protein FraEuI1c_1938 [Pseudofrankia inefficax]
MDDVFRTYLDPAFRYEWSRGPARVASRAEALRGGLNCVALAHLVLQDLFGHRLPASLRSLEMFRDRAHFEPVPAQARPRAGDLVWFGVADPPVPPEEFVPRYRDGELLNFRDFAVNHVAIHTGDRVGDDFLLLHASSTEGTNALWPLRRFADYPRYARTYGIRRLRAPLRRHER